MYDKGYGLYISRNNENALRIGGKITCRHDLTSSAIGIKNTACLQTRMGNCCLKKVFDLIKEKKDDLSGLSQTCRLFSVI